MHPSVAVIIGLETTAPGTGALIEIAVVETDTSTIRMNSLDRPWAPINSNTQSRHHLTDSMVAGAPTFRQILTDLITITDCRVILAFNSGSAFDTVIREAQRAGLDPEHLDDRDNWRCVTQVRSSWLGHPDHYPPISPTPFALDQCHATLNVIHGVPADCTQVAWSQG